MKKCDKCERIYCPQDHAVGTIAIKIYDSNHISWSYPNVYDCCSKCMKKIEKLILTEIKND